VVLQVMSTQPTEESLAMTKENKESVRSEATLDPTTTTTTITVTPLESPGLAAIDAVHSTTSTPTTAASEEDPPDMIRTESYRNSLTEGGDHMATPARASTHNSSEEEEGEDSEEETMPMPPQHRAPPTISAPSLNSLSSDVAIGVSTHKLTRFVCMTFPTSIHTVHISASGSSGRVGSVGSGATVVQQCGAGWTAASSSGRGHARPQP
jgi:hypothetical protein